MSHRKDPESPATTSHAYDLMIDRWEKTDSILGGTETMRDAGVKLLPMHTEEGQSAWSERLFNNVLLNLTELTLESWVGRPFKEPVKRNDDIPTAVNDLLDDVDMLGNDITVFCRNWFREGVAKAFAHVWVDVPPTNDLGRPRTKEDDLDDPFRPFWVAMAPEDVFFAHSTVIGGKEVLDHVRWSSNAVVMDGFAEVIVPQIHAATLTLVEDEVSGEVEQKVERIVWEWVQERGKNNTRKKPRWVIVNSFFMDIDEIPLVTFYADRKGLMTGKAPVQDLVDLNIRWWQSNSDQIAILTVSRFAILAASGVSDTNDLVIGPNNWLGMEAPNGRFYYVEHDGKAIGAGRQDLLDLEEQMGNYGADFLKKRPGNATATARALDAAEATSPLQDVAVRFQDAVASVLRLTDKWIRIESGQNPDEADGGTIEVITDYGPEEADQVYASLLMFARTNRDISRPQLIAQLKAIGVLPDSFDDAANERELEAELDKIAEMMAKEADLDPEGPDEPDDDDSDDGESGPNKDNRVR